MFEFLSQKFSGVLSWLKDKGRLTEGNIAEALEQVKTALIEADVPYNLVDEFLSQIQKETIDEKVKTKINPGHKFIKIVYDKLLAFLGGEKSSDFSFQIPSVIMVMGLQGSGKTTTIGKLANWTLKEAKKRNKNRRILCSSVDFYRPAAIDQLEILSKKIGVDFYRAKNSDPVLAAVETHNYFKNNSYDHLLLDTAGRLHIDNDMMKELRDIESRLKPKHKILVLDAMTGQESLKVATAFDQAVGFCGAILTKMDSSTRGGAAFSFRFALKKPILFVGSGEKIEDLEAFIPERMATRILGMGDLLTLIEKTEDTIDVNRQEDMAKRMISGGFTLEDFATQLQMVEKMGSLQKIISYMPFGSSLSSDKIEEGQKEMKIFKAIISSMNKKERLFPEILDGSRKARIAKGSGTLVQDVNKLLGRFEQSKQFVKLLKKNGKFKNFMR